MVPSCDRNCNPEREPCVFSTQTHTFYYKIRAYSAAGAPSSRINGFVVITSVWRRHRESLLNGRSSASHLFYSMWSTVGSRPGALSEHLVLTSSDNELEFPTQFPEYYRMSFSAGGGGIPEPSPECLSIKIHLHWLHWILGALYFSGDEEWQGERGVIDPW